MTGKNGLKKLLIGATIVAGLVGGAAAPAAASTAAPADVQATACGCWASNQNWAFYTHCTGSRQKPALTALHAWCASVPTP